MTSWISIVETKKEKKAWLDLGNNVLWQSWALLLYFEQGNSAIHRLGNVRQIDTASFL